MQKEQKTLDNLKEEELKELMRLSRDGVIEKELTASLEKFKNPKTVCPVCNTAIKDGEGLTLIFGDKDLKKKATFDAKDCLEYFLSKIM